MNYQRIDKWYRFFRDRWEDNDLPLPPRQREWRTCSKCGNYRRHNRKKAKFQGWCVDCSRTPSESRRRACRKYGAKFVKFRINGKPVRIPKDEIPELICKLQQKDQSS